MIMEYTQTKTIVFEGEEIKMFDDLISKLVELSTKQIGFKKPSLILTEDEYNLLTTLKQTNVTESINS